MICLVCGGAVAHGVCRNCGTPDLGLPFAPAAPLGDGFERVPVPELRGDVNLAAAGLAEILTAAGEDATRPEVAETPAEAVRALLGLTSGYDTDPGDAFDSAPIHASDTPRAKLSLSVPLRTACERCMLPVFGEVYVSCKPRDRALDGSHLARLVGTLSARLQSEGQLAEQVAAAVVQMGGAERSFARVRFRRPCDDCGAGRAVTTARARRAAPAGGDPPQQTEGGG